MKRKKTSGTEAAWGLDGGKEMVMGQEEGKEGTEKRSGNDTMRFTSHLQLVTVEKINTKQL